MFIWLFVVAGEESGGELGLGPIVTATALALRTRTAITAISAWAAIPVASLTARTTVAVTTAASAAAPMTIAAASAFAIAARFTRLARRAGVGQLFAGFLIDQAHRQSHLSALIDLEKLDLDLLAFRQNVADVLDPLVLDFGDMHQPVLAGHEGHECTEIDD